MAKTDIEVKIIGADSNIFNLLGICRRALQKAKRMDLWDEFYAEATSGDYNHALTTVCDYFVVDADEDEDEEYNRWLEDSINGICEADEED